MIDPTNLIRPIKNCSEFALFACCVQGKMAKIQADKFNEAMEILYEMFPSYENMPFACIRALTQDELMDLLKRVRLGQYDRVIRAWRFLSDTYRDDDIFEIEKLEQGFGIGPKTSRFIVGYCYDIPVGILDRHVLSFLRQQGKTVLKSTPQNRVLYAKLEKEFLDFSKENGLHPLDFDTKIWNKFCK